MSEDPGSGGPGADAKLGPSASDVLSLALGLHALLLLFSYAVGFRGLGTALGLADDVRWTDAYVPFAIGSGLVALGLAYWLLAGDRDVGDAVWTAVVAAVPLGAAGLLLVNAVGHGSSAAAEAAVMTAVGVAALAVGFRGRSGPSDVVDR